MKYPYSFPVIVMRGTPGKYGDRTYTDHHVIEGCFTAPRFSSEPDERGSRVIVGQSLYGPADSDILATDRVKMPDGIVYRVVGEAAVWKNPFTGWSPGFEAALERVA